MRSKTEVLKFSENANFALNNCNGATDCPEFWAQKIGIPCLKILYSEIGFVNSIMESFSTFFYAKLGNSTLTHQNSMLNPGGSD